MSDVARVLLAEPDAPTRMGVRLALTRGGRFEIAAEAHDARSAAEAAERLRPDLALIATDLPGGGLDAVRRIGERVGETKLVVLTGRQDADELISAVLAGAAGYFGKDVDPSRLPLTLERILAGEAAVPRRYTADVLEALRGRDARRRRVFGPVRSFVTDRQWEILDLLAEGRSTAEMARRLGISEVTARRHISSVVRKLGVKDRAGAVELMRERSSE